MGYLEKLVANSYWKQQDGQFRLEARFGLMLRRIRGRRSRARQGGCPRAPVCMVWGRRHRSTDRCAAAVPPGCPACCRSQTEGRNPRHQIFTFLIPPEVEPSTSELHLFDNLAEDERLAHELYPVGL